MQARVEDVKVIRELYRETCDSARSKYVPRALRVGPNGKGREDDKADLNQTHVVTGNGVEKVQLPETEAFEIGKPVKDPSTDQQRSNQEDDCETLAEMENVIQGISKWQKEREESLKLMELNMRTRLNRVERAQQLCLQALEDDEAEKLEKELEALQQERKRREKEMDHHGFTPRDWKKSAHHFQCEIEDYELKTLSGNSLESLDESITKLHSDVLKLHWADVQSSLALEAADRFNSRIYSEEARNNVLDSSSSSQSDVGMTLSQDAFNALSLSCILEDYHSKLDALLNQL